MLISEMGGVHLAMMFKISIQLNFVLLLRLGIISGNVQPLFHIK